MDTITLTVLGCSSSSGTPVIGCNCACCTSSLAQNQRSRCSAYVTVNDQGWLIDTGPDFRTQALRENISRVDGVLYTHPHADHLNGIDDLRAFCYRQKNVIPIYGSPFTINNIQTRFDYAFLPPGSNWNRPALKANVLPLSLDTEQHYLHASEHKTPRTLVNKTINQPLDETVNEVALVIENTPVFHYLLPHGRWFSSVFRIGNIAWLTDINHIHESVIEHLQGLDFLFLDCLTKETYPSHLSVQQAFDYAKQIGAKHTYFIHITHALEYEALQAICPPNCFVAYDGLRIQSAY